MGFAAASTPALGGRFSSHERIAVLDLMRFVAALSVVFFHYGFRGYTAGGLQLISFSALSPVARYGYLGVNLFFMISGFVISMSAEGKSAASFAASRFSRLYPAYWVACTLTFIVVPLLGAPHLAGTFHQWLVNLTMLQQAVGVPDIDGSYWSLFAELRFYLLIFLISATRLFRFLPAFLVVWAAYLLAAKRGVVWPPSRFAIFPYGAYFIAGAAFYLVYQKRAVPVAWALVGVSGVLAYYECTRDARHLTRYFDQPISPLVAALIVATFFVIFALLALRKLDSVERPWFFAVGAMTYPLYLIHQYIGYALLNKLAEGSWPYLTLLLIVLLMLALSWSLNRFIEIPARRALKRLVQATSPKNAPPPST
jgi:peptidoglycan/LPS O-acetylase OafA/YrhL